MSRPIALALLGCLVLLPPARASEPPVTAFTHVRLRTMEDEALLGDHTVVVRGGEIVAVGPSPTTKAPEGATIVDGRSTLVLMPALCDLHVHATAPDDLLLYVANGVTTVLNLGHASSVFVTKTRARIDSGEILGPTCFVAPMLNGLHGSDLPCDTAERARESIRLAKRMGYEFVKVYNELSRDAFLAICDEAREQQLTVVGHGVRSMGLAASFEAGQTMLAHGEEYFYTELQGANASRIPRAIEITKDHGVYVIPNLSAYEPIAAQFGRPELVREEFLARPERRWLRNFWVEKWTTGRYADMVPGGIDDRVAMLRRMTKELSEAGVPLLLGTDSPDIPGVYPGVSLHEELEKLVASGLTPFEALSCGTRVAGEFLELALPDRRPVGTVAVGNQADLLLLERDPVEAISNSRAIAGVMVRGRWLPREEIDRRLEELAPRLERERAVLASLDARTKDGGLATAIAELIAKLEAGKAAELVDLDEEVVNERGYVALLRAKDPAAACAWFELGVALRPESANAWDSLGEGSLAAGERERAVECYRRASKLDPWNGNAAENVRKLGTEVVR